MAAAASGTFFDFFYQLYAYREYLRQSVKRDLTTKYKRSALGYLWTMLHPLGMMLVLTVVLSHIVKLQMRDFAVFFLSGLIAWNYFNSTVMMSLHSIRSNARLFGQIAVPRYIFIISIAASNLFNYFVALAPLCLVTLFVGRDLHASALLWPLMVLPLVFVTVGVALVLAVSNVFFEDTYHLVEVGMNALYFLLPVLYGRDLLPPWLVKWLVLNPLFCQIEFVRGIFYEGSLPSLPVYILNLSASGLVLMFGLWVFRRSEDKFLYFV
ncbi:MAG: ABC transporter permease [Oligoflexia bacterium]|nr:ABC transporter permease [Oligoflexia bacterium]